MFRLFGAQDKLKFQISVVCRKLLARIPIGTSALEVCKIYPKRYIMIYKSQRDHYFAPIKKIVCLQGLIVEYVVLIEMHLEISCGCPDVFLFSLIASASRFNIYGTGQGWTNQILPVNGRDRLYVKLITELML